jgi:hypothetical protein
LYAFVVAGRANTAASAENTPSSTRKTNKLLDLAKPELNDIARQIGNAA